MRKNLKLVALILAATFAFTLLFGCGVKPKDAMINALKKNQQLKSYKVKGEMALEIKDSKITQGISFNNAKVTWDGIVQQEPQKAILNYNVEVQDISFKGNLYINKDKMYIKLPSAILPQNKYIEYDLKDIQDKSNKKISKNDEKLASELIYEIFNSIAEDKFTDAGKQEIDGSKLSIVRTELSQNDIKTLIKNTADIISKEKYSNLLNSGKSNLQTEMKKSLNDAAGTIDENVQLEKFRFDVATDKKGYAKNEEVLLNLKSKKDSSSIKLSLSNTLSDINNTLKFDFPTFNKNNTIPYNQYSPYSGLPGKGADLTQPL